MTEQEAREILDEIRTVRPRKRVGRDVYELRPNGRLDTYRRTKSGKRMIFDRTIAADTWWLHPDVKAWLATRGIVVDNEPKKEPTSECNPSDRPV